MPHYTCAQPQAMGIKSWYAPSAEVSLQQYWDVPGVGAHEARRQKSMSLEKIFGS